jgi:two-component system response regulator NreC
MREGLRAVIDREPGLVVVAQAATARDARSLDVTPDVIVTDIDLPDAKYGDVISGLRESFRQQSSILVFTPVGDPVEVESVFAAGADGYLLETAETTDLFAGIRAVAAGETYLQPSLGAKLARSRQADTTLGLSPQEKHVLRLLVLGHTNVDVARLCHTGLRTAETHRANIQRKLDRRTRAELVEYAREIGLVQLGPP